MTRPVQLESRCGECLLFGAIQGLADGLVLVDGEGRIFQLNRRAQELLELGSRHVIGTNLTDALRHPGLASFWASASTDDVPATSDLTFYGGVSVRATVSLCLSASNETIGKALLLRDVTHEKKIHVELSASVARRLVEMTGGAEMDDDLSGLTRREVQILRLVAAGFSNAGIAQRLHVSGNTVASHLKHLYAKLRVSNRSQAAAYARAHGIRPPEG